MRYSVVLTSCGRFDLLGQTLASLARCLDIAPQKVVVTEDSGDPAVARVLERVNLPFELILNATKLGQMRSIDRGYQAVDTPYILHCEDDWEFMRTGFLDESRRLLEADPAISMVGLRAKRALNPRLHDMPDETLAGVRIFRHDPSLHPENGGYSFNPGLRRRADYLDLAPFAAIGPEPEVSVAFKRRGQHIANLAEPAVRHIGEGRHVDDPTQPRRPRSAAGRIARSLSKKWRRLQRRFEQH